MDFASIEEIQAVTTKLNSILEKKDFLKGMKHIMPTLCIISKENYFKKFFCNFCIFYS